MGRGSTWDPVSFSCDSGTRFSIVIVGSVVRAVVDAPHIRDNHCVARDVITAVPVGFYRVVRNTCSGVQYDPHSDTNRMVLTEWNGAPPPAMMP